MDTIFINEIPADNECVCTYCLRNTKNISRDYIRAMTYDRRCKIIYNFCERLQKVSSDFQLIAPLKYEEQPISTFIKLYKESSTSRNIRLICTRFFQFEFLSKKIFEQKLPKIDLFYEGYLEGLTHETKILYIQYHEECPLNIEESNFLKVPLIY